MDTLIELLLANRDLFLVNQRNRKALQAFAEDGRHVDAGQDIEARFGHLLADPKIPLERRVRMAASVGAVVATLAAGEVVGDATADEVAGLAGRGSRRGRTARRRRLNADPRTSARPDPDAALTSAWRRLRLGSEWISGPWADVMFNARA